MIDLHCHLLPGIDDGPPDMTATLELGRAAHAAGTHTIVATPHVSWDYPNTAEVIARGVEEVRAAFAAEHVPIEVLTGAEVAVTRVGEMDGEELAALRLGRGPYLLVECPLGPSSTDAVWGLLESLLARDQRILLAHPERCPVFQRDLEFLGRCVDHGMLTSLTAGSFAGRFGGTVRRIAEQMWRAQLVYNVSSDAHDTVRRPPAIAGGLRDHGRHAAARWLTEEVPRALIDGTALPYLAREPPRTGLLRRWRS
ncbi:MAG TPA: CpsB/CapC family capsule biosynthesis tyrosine phosphatase [Solirubrobacteraceae bacterium]|jgi:protein-tyrosine phosphatase|nr:CpsB/CapC family capsule biosynthesis tyrosine phosphatase [Solirubrobacteraceae bacterium]